MIRINSDMKTVLLIQTAAAVIGFAVCLFLNVWSAVILLIIAVIYITSETIVLIKRSKKISTLCDEIDKILHGNESVSFNNFREGELGVLSAEIHKMTIRLREQNSSLKNEKQFLKEQLEDISHQLRTPLTTILVILGMMRQDISPEERTKHISEMFSLLSKMQWLLETMLSISRLDAGAAVFNPEKICVSDIVRSAYEPLSISIELKNITVRIETEGTLYADKQYMIEAVENILKNCMDHTPEGGEIKIFSQENNIFTEIIISDTGAGIPEEELSHVFERFYRGKSFSNKGYGIGLAFANKIAVSQNGTLSVKNARNGGAVFELRIYKSSGI